MIERLEIMKVYVAYGSNLNKKQMSQRCPDAKVISTGMLNGWRLVYRGSLSGSYLSIVEDPKAKTPVVLWSISKRDERMLDIYEGYPRFYTKEDIIVDTPDGEAWGMVYIINKKAVPGRPSWLYVETCKQGYKDNGLDLKYLNESLRYNVRECAKEWI